MGPSIGWAYQSDEDTVSDEDRSEYALTISETRESAAACLDDSEPQDIPDTERASDMEHRQDEDLDSDEDQ